MFSRLRWWWQNHRDRRLGREQERDWQQEYTEGKSKHKLLEREFNSDRSPLVRYLPATESTTFSNQTPTPEWLARWVPSDLPSICLELHNACCHICLMDFDEPQLNSSLTQPQSDNQVKIEPLRQLLCRHVFHALCIDAYLQSDESDRYLCPVCQKKVVSLTSYLEQYQIQFTQIVTKRRKKRFRRSDAIPEGGLHESYIEISLKFGKNGLPILRNYTFESSNKYLKSSSSNRSFLNDAKKLLENNGNLSETALLIEAAIQEGDLGEGGYEAWVLLGETRTLDMRYEAGLQAITEGVRRASAKGSPAGMLFLVSQHLIWTSQKACCIVLLRWLRMRYSVSLFSKSLNSINRLRIPSLDSIIDVFLSVVHGQHREGAIDPDIQFALGILFLIKQDHLSEIACYASALATQPRNYLLWNLWAVSLNESDTQEKSEVYTEALRLHPSYTEANFCLGVHSGKEGAHREAAQYFLSALALQQAAGGKGTNDVWSELHSTFLSMDRQDLADISTLEAQTNLGVYRREGFKFLAILDATTHVIM